MSLRVWGLAVVPVQLHFTSRLGTASLIEDYIIRHPHAFYLQRFSRRCFEYVQDRPSYHVPEQEHHPSTFFAGYTSTPLYPTQQNFLFANLESLIHMANEFEIVPSPTVRPQP
ncbi:hypothetical protein BGZ57DRAFT_92175 [Hyaloscypha finlandica]|nr:hypothetical protein BGZ57DRAFT_92175 [Hyaloscypha finlandica]